MFVCVFLTLECGHTVGELHLFAAGVYGTSLVIQDQRSGLGHFTGFHLTAFSQKGSHTHTRQQLHVSKVVASIR